jgi:hypothetical protein
MLGTEQAMHFPEHADVPEAERTLHELEALRQSRARSALCKSSGAGGAGGDTGELAGVSGTASDQR